MIPVLMAVLLSLGAINGLIPIIVILILLVAAAGLNRGYSLFNFFGITTFTSVNPAGKASIAGKNAFVIPLFGQHAGQLGIGRRIMAARGRSKSSKYTTKVLIGTAAGTAGAAARPAPRRAGPVLLGRTTAGRATMFRRRLGKGTRKFFTGTPGKPMGARNRARKMASWTAQRASSANATLAGSSAAYSKTVGRAASSVSRASSALKRRWQSRSKMSRVATGSLLGIGIFAANPVLGVSYGILRAGHAYRTRKSRSPNAAVRRSGSHFWRNIDKNFAGHVTGVGSTVAMTVMPGAYLAYRGMQKVVDTKYRKPVEMSKTAAQAAVSPRYDSARSAIAGYTARYGADTLQMNRAQRAAAKASMTGDEYKTMRKEHKAMNKEVLSEVKKADRAAASPGSYNRSVPIAVGAALYNASKKAINSYASQPATPTWASAAPRGLASPVILAPGGGAPPTGVRDWPSKIRERLSEAGTKPTSTSYGMFYRGVVGVAGVAAATGGFTAGSIIRNRSVSKGVTEAKEQHLAAAGSSTNETAAEMLSNARAKHLSRLTDPDRIDTFIKRYEDNISERRMAVTRLNNEAALLSSARAGAASAVRHEEAARLAKEADERSKEAAKQAKILADKQKELDKIHATAASNAFTSQATLQDLYDNHGKDSGNLRTALAGNSHTPVDVLRTIATTGATGEKLAAASNPSTPRDSLETLSASPYRGMSEADISKEPPDKAKTMRESAEIASAADKALKARMDLARDRRTSPTVLEAIGSAGNEAEQVAVASNPSTPENVLARLQSSSNVSVSAAAAESLRRLRAKRSK